MILLSDKPTSNDSLLWNRIKADDPKALAEVYNLHVKALYNYGNKIFQNSQIVEDAIHDLFLDLWNSRKNLSQIISIKAYLYASLRRKIINSIKSSGLLEFDSEWDEIHLLTSSEEEKLVEKELIDEQTAKLRSHLNKLSPRQYEAIVLRFYDKMGYNDIANLMEVNEQSVRNLIHRGLENMRKYSHLTINF